MINQPHPKNKKCEEKLTGTPSKWMYRRPISIFKKCTWLLIITEMLIKRIRYPITTCNGLVVHIKKSKKQVEMWTKNSHSLLVRLLSCSPFMETSPRFKFNYHIIWQFYSKSSISRHKSTNSKRYRHTYLHALEITQMPNDRWFEKAIAVYIHNGIYIKKMKSCFCYNTDRARRYHITQNKSEGEGQMPNDLTHRTYVEKTRKGVGSIQWK